MQTKCTAEREIEHQTEVAFRSAARAMRLFGEWIAEKLQLTPEERDSYKKEMIAMLMEHGGDGEVLKKALSDLAARGTGVTEHEVREAMVRIRQEARQYVLENCP